MSAAVVPSERLALREVLLRSTRLRLEQLEEAVRRQQEKGGRLTDAIIELGHLREEEVLQVLGAQFGMALHGEVRTSEVDPELTARVPITSSSPRAPQAAMPMSRASPCFWWRAAQRAFPCTAIRPMTASALPT